MTNSLTPFGIYISSRLKKRYECSIRIKEASFYLGLVLENPKEKKDFFTCYNKQNSLKLKKQKIDDFEINISEKEVRSRRAQKIVDKSKEMEGIYKEVMLFKYELEAAYRLVKKLDKYDNIIAKLLKSYVYLISGNSSRAASVLLEIMEKELFYHSLTSDIKLLKLSSQIRMSVELISKLKNEFQNKRVIENIIYYIVGGSSGEYQKRLSRRFNLDLRVTTVLKKYQSIQYGRKFPFVWGPLMLSDSWKRFSEEFTRKGIVSKELLLKRMDLLLFYRNVLKIDPIFKTSILKILKTLKNKNNYYQKEILLRSLDDGVFYKYVSAHFKINWGVLANLKRDFYHSKLKANINLHYTIQNLISLGDEDPLFINKLLALENARI